MHFSVVFPSEFGWTEMAIKCLASVMDFMARKVGDLIIVRCFENENLDRKEKSKNTSYVIKFFITDIANNELLAARPISAGRN